MLISRAVFNGAVLAVLNGTLNSTLNGTLNGMGQAPCQLRVQRRSREDVEVFPRHDAQVPDARDNVSAALQRPPSSISEVAGSGKRRGIAVSGVGDQQMLSRRPTRIQIEWVWPFQGLPEGKEHTIFKNPEWFRLQGSSPIVCAIILAAAGVLCSAGGIGGGGIYVTVLMVFGKLDIVDAVPLSKAIVFLGSLSSLALNLFKANDTKAPLIDYNICRAIVPSSLFGTFAGVFLNGVLRDTVLELLLTIVLSVMAYMVCKSTVVQYNEETAAAEKKAASTTPHSDSMTPRKEIDMTGSRNAVRVEDIFISAGLLVVVIGGNVLHHNVMHSYSEHQIATALSIAIPCAACGISTCYYASRLYTEEWRPVTIAQYNLISIAAGMMAGLIGIGGGLIFAPFFLLMQVEPSIAVATSSTCVVFTSSSTSLQYFFLGRVILSLGLVYGVVTVVASYIGTRCVHFLQDNCNARKSYISAIVGVGVLISAMLSLYNLVLDFLDVQ